MTEYKIVMRLHPGQYESWTVMDACSSYDRALKALESYRKSMPRHTFRLEKHTMEVIDV